MINKFIHITFIFLIPIDNLRAVKILQRPNKLWVEKILKPLVYMFENVF